ncbi:hypothetical protein [Clostridium algidicarnis]|uniref:hypothetical protein n=1 Tax=Clostridium algidicarnis TaxID=37659 RepID=UPI003FD76181
MISKIAYIVFLIVVVLGSVYITKRITKRFNINRWIIGWVAPLILIIPSILFKEINPIVWNLLLLIFSVMCIMFFEMTRIKLEKNEIKGIINYNKNK